MDGEDIRRPSYLSRDLTRQLTGERAFQTDLVLRGRETETCVRLSTYTAKRKAEEVSMSGRQPSVIGTLLVALALSGPAGVAGEVVACNKPQTQLESYLAKHYSQQPLVVLALDHQTQEWTGYRWDSKAKTLTPLVTDSELKLPFTNKPRVFLGKDEVDRLAIFVTNTNPLLFATKHTGATVAEIEDLATLQKLAGLLGGFISAGIAAGVPEFERLEALDIPTVEAAHETLVLAQKALVPIDGDVKELREHAELIAGLLKTQGANIKDALGGLEKPRSSFADDLQSLAEAGSEIKSFVQLVENDSLAEVGTPGFPRLSVTASSLARHAAAIDEKRLAVKNTQPVCIGSLAALRDALRLLRQPHKEPGELKTAEDGYKRSLEALADLRGCNPTNLGISIDRIRKLLEKRTPLSAVDPTKEKEDQILRLLFLAVDSYLTLVDQHKAGLESAGKLLSEAGTSAKVAEAVQAFNARFTKHHVASDVCSLRSGVIEVPRRKEIAEKLPWTKVGTESFQVVADSPFKDAVLFRHAADISASYEIQRASNWEFDVDAATIYTEVASPVYSAVPEPNTATPDPEDTTSFIRQTDEEGRAGELALFLSLQWRSRREARNFFSIGPQLGAGLNADHPALFVGFGVGLGRYVKLGLGYNWQRVKELRDQKADQLLGSGEAIQLRDGFDHGFYGALSITIDNLPFFKAP
jgi:hypothetical protein